MPKSANPPILGRAFNDVLTELHAHVFTGVPGESDPFMLTLLEREYLAFALACYYQCDHCERHHARYRPHRDLHEGCNLEEPHRPCHHSALEVTRHQRRLNLCSGRNSDRSDVWVT